VGEKRRSTDKIVNRSFFSHLGKDIGNHSDKHLVPNAFGLHTWIYNRSFLVFCLSILISSKNVVAQSGL
jgi:hypothetical protein